MYSKALDVHVAKAFGQAYRHELAAESALRRGDVQLAWLAVIELEGQAERLERMVDSLPEPVVIDDGVGIA